MVFSGVNKRQKREFSTENADYILNPGFHQQETIIDNIDSIDALALELEVRTKRIDMYHTQRQKDVQWCGVYEKAFKRETPLPIFYTDIHHKSGTSNGSIILNGVFGILLETVKFMAPLYITLNHQSLATLPFSLPFLSVIGAIGRGRSKIYDKVHSYSLLSNFYNVIIGLRSADVARKAEEFIAPELRKRNGSKPRIFIDYGAGHGDIELYIKSKKLRDFTLAVSKTIPNTVDKTSMDSICELVRADMQNPIDKEFLGVQTLPLAGVDVRHLVYKIK